VHTASVCVCVVRSDYKRNLSDFSRAFESAPAGPRVSDAVGQLFMALVFKIILTVITFGIKVLHLLVLMVLCLTYRYLYMFMQLS
jgi:hypothetical protein